MCATNTKYNSLTEHDKKHATHDWVRNSYEQCPELSEHAKQ